MQLGSMFISNCNNTLAIILAGWWRGLIGCWVVCLVL